MKKRKQHYVWEHYLSAWATDGRIWCLRDDRRFCTNTDNVANERDFYRLEEMTENDLAFVERAVIAPLDPGLQELARGWIAPFQTLFLLRREYEARGEKHPEFETLLDVEINNLEEDMHESIESTAVPLLADLRSGLNDFMDDDEKAVHFARFIATQYMRTPTIMQSSIAALRGAVGVNIAATWGLLRTIFATNIGSAIFARRGMLRTTFLDADPSTEFITGDQPIVNVRAAGAPPDEVPTELELFYPLSPALSVVFAFDAPDRTTNRRRLGAAETAKFNDMIVARSYKQLYASSAQALPAANTVG